jgi:cell division protein FtsL
VIASQAVRLASPSPRRTTVRAAQVQRVQKARRSPSRTRAISTPARSAQRVVRAASWDLRVFTLAIGAIVFCFAIALVYVSQTTALSVAGYDAQKLAAQRDELRRQNSLLEVQSARLDSPARITADASRLGMVHARFVPVIPVQPLTAKR